MSHFDKRYPGELSPFQNRVLDVIEWVQCLRFVIAHALHRRRIRKGR